MSDYEGYIIRHIALFHYDTTIAMSLIIEHLIIHSLRQDETGALKADTRTQEIKATGEVQEWIEQLHRIYQQKGNKSYASFLADTEQPEEPSPFPQLFKQYLDKDASFVDFTHQSTTVLLAQLNHYQYPDEGVLIFCKYQFVGVDYILLGLLDCETSVTLTEQLELSQIKYIDLSKMQLVARIDITEFQTNPDSKRYISFIKGRIGRKVSDFFMDFLGAAEGIDVKLQNQLLIQAVNEYCQQVEMPSEEKAATKKQIVEYYKGQSEEGADIAVKSVAEYLPKQNDGADFYSFISDTYDLDEEFPVATTALRKLTKFVGSGGGLNISFDEKLLGERIAYDAQTDTLTIKGTPPNLKDQLLRMLKAK